MSQQRPWQSSPASATRTGSYDYSNDYVGVIFGTGGGPNTYITSGPSSQLVDAIYGRGSGNADAAYCPGCSLADQQAAIDALDPDFAGMTQFTGTYTLTDPNATVFWGPEAEHSISPRSPEQ